MFRSVLRRYYLSMKHCTAFYGINLEEQDLLVYNQPEFAALGWKPRLDIRLQWPVELE